MILGVIMIGAPFLAAMMANVIVGWLLVFGGVMQVVHAFQAKMEGGLIWKLLMGILFAAAGVWLLAKPLQGVLSLTLALGCFLLAGGLLECIMSLQLKPARGWGYHLFDGVIELLLGAFILAKWPLDAPWVLGTFFGVSLLVKGIAISSFSCATRAACAKA
jgi:uncharacterized membrane protein HdeD (DUF308 family)